MPIMHTLDLGEGVEVHLDPVSALVTDVMARGGAEAISAAMARGFGRLIGFAQRAGLALVGHPRALRSSRSDAGASVTIALPVTAPARVLVHTPAIRLGVLPGMTAWRFSHRGPCHAIGDAYAAITAWLVSHGAVPSESDVERLTPVWEEYVCDPASSMLDDVLTFIYIPRGVATTR